MQAAFVMEQNTKAADYQMDCDTTVAEKVEIYHAVKRIAELNQMYKI